MAIRHVKNAGPVWAVQAQDVPGTAAQATAKVRLRAWTPPQPEVGLAPTPGMRLGPLALAASSPSAAVGQRTATHAQQLSALRALCAEFAEGAAAREASAAASGLARQPLHQPKA